MKIGVYIHDGFTFEPGAECPYTWNLLEYEIWHSSHLTEEQPKAHIWANLWSISSWQKREGGSVTSLTDPRWRRFWDDEIAFSQQLLASLELFPAGVGIAFPLHHWYRGFCQQWYPQSELPFWPGYDLLRSIHQDGRPLLAWTHFIVENDPYHPTCACLP